LSYKLFDNHITIPYNNLLSPTDLKIILLEILKIMLQKIVIF